MGKKQEKKTKRRKQEKQDEKKRIKRLKRLRPGLQRINGGVLGFSVLLLIEALLDPKLLGRTRGLIAHIVAASITASSVYLFFEVFQPADAPNRWRTTADGFATTIGVLAVYSIVGIMLNAFANTVFWTAFGVVLWLLFLYVASILRDAGKEDVDD